MVRILVSHNSLLTLNNGSLLLVIIALQIVSMLSNGYAQPMPAQDFYPKDFVNKRPLNDKPDYEAKSVNEPHRGTSQENVRVDQQTITRTSPQLSPSRRRTPSGIVYVTSIDSGHFTQLCDKVLALNRQGKIQINLILHYGNYANVSERQKTNLLEHGIHIIELSELPDDLPLSQSPAWVIFGDHTPDASNQDGPAAYLVQGYLNVEQFFDQFGVFTLPPGLSNDTKGETSVGNLSGF